MVSEFNLDDDDNDDDDSDVNCDGGGYLPLFVHELILKIR